MWPSVWALSWPPGFQDSSVLWPVSLPRCSGWPSTSPWYVYPEQVLVFWLISAWTFTRLPLWAVMNNFLWTLRYVFLCRHDFTSLGHMSVSPFEELPNCFPEWLNHFTTTPASTRVPISMHLHQHMIVFFIIATQAAEKWHFIMIFFICLVTNDVAHLPMCPLPVGISSLDTGMCMSFVHLFPGSAVFLLLNCKSSL